MGLLQRVPAHGRDAHTWVFYACVERLRELEVPIAAGPKERPDGAVQVFVCDPDGHVVELTSMSASA